MVERDVARNLSTWAGCLIRGAKNWPMDSAGACSRAQRADDPDSDDAGRGICAIRANARRRTIQSGIGRWPACAVGATLGD